MFGRGQSNFSRIPGGFGGWLFRTILHSLQFIAALVVVGMYGVDLNNARQHNLAGDPKWVFAETVGGLSALTVFIYMFPCIRSYYAWAWDVVLSILWIVVFGIFGRLFLSEDPEGNAGIERMKRAAWFDLVNMFLWFISATYGTFMFFRQRRAKVSTYMDGE
ncbi:MAG: hypothetical protein M4579_003462 [Chaenotheca gracillima]|nr:MAG: hypothetical protein M4579_003462 [Chaenotheca gracillima]